MITLLTAIYILCAVILGIYTASQAILLLLYLRHRHQFQVDLPHIRHYPQVGIQLPLYNEKYVVEPLLDAIAALDYPRDNLTIQVLDDSNDDTCDIVAAKVAQLRRQGINIQHVCRQDRVGYKAGALEYGLQALEHAEFIAIFDADFLPPPDFLKKTLPYFIENPRLGIVQTRWGHLNTDTNWLTQAQSLTIDAHFVVEQFARNRGGLLLTFNGTGGIWRKETIISAGGWSWDTLTEDLDLSFRAQIAGWEYLYLPDIVVPGEIPPMMLAYRRQQARWAEGTNQCLVKLTPLVWRSELPFFKKVMAMQPLMQYLPHLLMLLLLILTPPLLALDALANLPLAWLGFVGLLPPIVHSVAQSRLYGGGWLRRMMYFPIVLLIGTGIMINNAWAAIKAFTRTQHEFARTPKFGKGVGKSYRLRGGKLTYFEIGFAIYAWIGFALALRNEPALASLMALNGTSLTAMLLWNAYDRLAHTRETAAEVELEATIEPEEPVYT